MERGSTSDRTKPSRPKPGPWPPRIEPFVPANTDYNPRDLKSWAKRTGFNPSISGESAVSTQTFAPDPDLEKGPPPIRPEIVETVAKAAEDEGVKAAAGFKEKRKRARVPVEPKKEEMELKDKLARNGNGNIGNGNGGFEIGHVEGLVKRGEKERDVLDLDLDSLGEENGGGGGGGGRGGGGAGYSGGLVCGVTDNPGYGRLIFYGLQHYLSLAGSLVFIPIILVPTMGGTDEETATVISTMLLVSGITTIMQSYFGTRLPLVQGSSFVYLAPALVIINSEEFRNLSENKFKHIMRELQGAIIVGSVFQMLLGYSGLMSLLLRLINPVVVAPTVAAVGLAYFSYGFPQAGTCAGISIPLILLVLVFTLYLRRVSIFGHRIFLVYAVPLSVIIVWAYAFFLTASGAYNYKGCTPNIPSSNILLDGCRRHALTMKHCRTDVSNAWNAAAWVRVPYPFQWGSPQFHFKTSIIMIITSLVASVDSVGSYHVTSFLVNMRPPTPGIVSRGIGFEGFSSILAGLFGTGAGSTTLTENVHTIDVTKMASRKALEIGAALMIIFSFFGKVGALLASIPLALAASVLCFTWALTVALGLSTLQYTRTASSRNIIIIGFTLFISLSIPAYFQQYQPMSSLILPSYLLPYAAGSDGPIDIGSKGVNYALNSVLSLNMVVALLVAFVLDNTVPGTKQERGVYIWSESANVATDPAVLDLYMLPKRIRHFFSWAKCVGS